VRRRQKVAVAGLTAYVLFEKVVPEKVVPLIGASRFVGIGLVAWGLWVVFA